MSKVLVVDDQQDIVTSLTFLLQSNGHEVLSATNGKQALEIMQQHDLDVIISDVNMPEIDGHQLAKQIRTNSNNPLIPFIFLSAKTSLEHQQVGFSSGADQYVCKPIERAQRPVFLAMVDSLANKYKLQKQCLESSALCSLTNLPRRGCFYTALEKATNKLNTNDKKISIVILDIDHFKAVNDNHGHLVGDKILQQFSKVVKDSLRSEDMLFRYGGEEFALILPDADPENINSIIKRIKKNVSEFQFKNNLLITFSGGIYTLPSDVDSTNFESYVEYADTALYEAKNTGRNKTMKNLLSKIESVA